ncbi:uncharacterized protein CDV56_109263 [Aspergillus thermomutatus]|uniref:Uncharacterized protein n=1 Tax=Aspergillus thermomutatus TaxID=41047 RepID=A0A397HMV8_ASPTH|nr:uncharacterized protein CDV56_109263 [Aspergillus thermomutatus]RHZ64469.1 hypothetical protein CDV56_109263 [Aspergillus thermomutatus]
MHQDGGNTGTIDYAGPLGTNLDVTSAIRGLHILLWTKSGQMIAGYTSIGLTGLKWGLAAVDDSTLEVQSTWYPETDGQTLNVAYMELLLETDQVVVTSKEGQIYIVQLSVTDDGPSLTLNRTVNLTSVLAQDELLLNAMYDTAGNLWFTSGGLRAQGGHGDPEQNSTTIGYIEPDGKIHARHLLNQMVENGIAVSGTTVYVITGPSGTSSHANATGNLYALAPGPGDSIKELWSVPYEAGDLQKPGSFSRGSGATPALLRDQYVAITDNANSRVNLVIYHQEPQTDSEQVVCSVPLFGAGASNVDIAPLAHGDGDRYGVLLCNDYNAPPLYYSDSAGLNGDFNNLTQMAPGVVRVDVAADGRSCEIAWEQKDLRIQSVPLISTKNGLLYGYTQDVDLSLKGFWEWYAVALDWRTGKEVWRVRTGAGGTYNDDYQPGAIGPDGSFYQSVIGGIVKIHDGSP